MSSNELIITADGSHTLYSKAIDETYHSTHGAVQESQHIFIEAGLKQCNKSTIRVLEIGFGTGLNAFLTLLEAEKLGLNTHFTTLEKFPVDMSIALKLNYANDIDPNFKLLFEALHSSPWNEDVTISTNFVLRKIDADFTEYSFEDKYDLVIFDAFSPEKQPEMWTAEMFEILFKHCNTDAILTTYCAKGIVRRAMQSAGFTVERLAGPPGKREILRARKTN